MNKVTVILPTYREKNSIRECVDKFAALNEVEEIIVVNNNAESGTDDVLRNAPKVRIVYEVNQGYGAAIKKGLSESKSQLTAICEPDGTFEPKDLLKLLSYANEKDLVLGSRTVSSFIFDGANMGPFLKWGNWFVAKLIEVLFNTTYLSDVGCTFRILSKNFTKKLNDTSMTNSGYYGLQMMLFAIKNNFKYVQIPVHYKKRVGESASTGSFIKALILGLEMIREVLYQRIKP